MENIIEQFENQISIFERFKTKTESLIRDILQASSINYHQVTSRLKTKESIQSKIIKKQGYNNLYDITDIVGCRIILYFEDEVDKVAQIIEKEFVVDRINSIDKREIEVDRFGYLSLHYVVSLNKKRLRLVEYKEFKNLKIEIQIRSILQHSWAEIEHDIGYKGKHSIPDKAKRRFSRIAALLETADIEFTSLRNELSEYESNVLVEISKNPENVTLNKASVQSFINNNTDLIYVDEIVASYLNIILNKDSASIEEIISLLEFANIISIKDLIDVYKNRKECILEFSTNWREKSIENMEEKGTGVNGISLYDTAYYLIAKNKSEKEFEDFFENQYKNNMFKNYENERYRMYEAYKKINNKCH